MPFGQWIESGQSVGGKLQSLFDNGPVKSRKGGDIGRQLEGVDSSIVGDELRESFIVVSWLYLGF